MKDTLLTFLRSLFGKVSRPVMHVWRRFRRLRPRYQVIIGIVLIILIIAGFALARSGQESTTQNLRTVTLASVASLSGDGSTSSVLGTVRSVTEADLLAQTGGTVRSVNTRVGSSVGAGAVLAELENSAERAAVLQAEGAYDAAVASRSTTVTDIDSTVRTTYRSTFSTLEATLENQVDLFFGAPTSSGPDLTITAPAYDNQLSTARRDISNLMAAWRRNLESTDTRSPSALLAEMEGVIERLNSFMTTLSIAAYRNGSGTSAEQIAALESSRATIDATRASIASLRNQYDAEKARSASGAISETEARIKQALGTLRAAEAALERTVVRAPIGGTVNFLPIRIGDYVTPLQHVATVAQNGALEIVASISEDERNVLSVGQQVTVDEELSGIVTSIAPALDPITKQIEVHVAVSAGDTTLVNGQSVRIGIPSAAPVTEEEQATGPRMLPLAAVKLRANDRIVFTVNEEGRLVANQVTIGEVRGDRIEILSELSAEMRIVSDARGLAEGEKVEIAGP